MEQLLHYCWKHKLYPTGVLQTTDGQTVEVIDPGLHNYNAGPDFFNSKVKVDGQLWIGNVEIHDKASDWYQHRHDKDSAYDNVVLHVVGKADAIVTTNNGRRLPQLVVSVPEEVAANYSMLLSTEQYPPCYEIISDLSALLTHSWMSALQVERLEQKTVAIRERARLSGEDWEAAYFTTLARNYGFGINGDAFEAWAKTIPLNVIAHHRDDVFQIEAIFMGQAGLLEMEAIPERHQAAALNDGYFARLRNEYLYLRHKFSLHPINYKLWRFLRTRPQSFPQVRLSQLANLYCSHQSQLSSLTDCTTAKEIRQLLKVGVTPYWETHYGFGVESDKMTKRLSTASLDLLIINTAVPMLFAYGRHTQKDEFCDRAFELLEELKPENNNIVRMWQQCGLSVSNAGDSQALIQLKKEYCDKRDCLRCRFGFEYLKGHRK